MSTIRKKIIPITVISTLTAYASLGWYEGYQMRRSYKPLKYIPGPNCGWIGRGNEGLYVPVNPNSTEHLLCATPFSLVEKLWKQIRETEQVSQTQQRVTNGNEAGTEEPFRLLFVGDSMVMGIGIEAQDLLERGNELPQACARILSERLGRDVVWQSVGYNGATAKDVRDILGPQITDAVTILHEDLEKKEEATKLKVDLVVLMCGLNDAKDLVFFRGNPWEFRKELSTTIKYIHSLVGEQATIILPAYPIHFCAAFKSPPVRAAVITGMGYWDHQKDIVVKRLRASLEDNPAYSRYYYAKNIDTPEGFDLNSHPLQGTDGIHPNRLGYELFGISVAGHYLNAIKSIQ